MTDVHSRAGGFDTIRLIAALMVFHSHSFALAGLPEPWLAGTTYGGAAVLIFFVVSGYWVTESALQRTAVSYALARALRILPGLAICLVLTILACALASSIPVNDYLLRPATWRYMQNALPFFQPGVGVLPDVFEDGANPAPNGSLWTLRYEVMCYVVVGLAAVFGRRGVQITMAAAAILALAVLAQVLGSGPVAIDDRHIALLDVFQVRWIATFGAAFAFGAWLKGADDRALQKVILVSAVAMGLSWREPSIGPAVGIFLYGSLAIWVGRKFNLDARFTRGQDLSYGVYIYAFPCQQLAVRLIEPSDAAGFAAYYLVALVPTVFLAALSWNFIEKPAVLLKSPLAKGIEGWGQGIAGRRRAAA